MQVFQVSRVKIHFSLFETDLRECQLPWLFTADVDLVVVVHYDLFVEKKKVLSKLDIRKFMKRKNISDRQSVENNADKRFQK